MARTRVLSIDAWADGEGWTWNDTRSLGDWAGGADAVPDDDSDLMQECILRGYVAPWAAAGLSVERIGGDPETIEIQDAGTGEPLLAIVIDLDESEDA